MKTLFTFALCLCALVAHAANPSTKSFRALGGLLVTSNDVTGIITYDASGLTSPTGGVSAATVTNIVQSFIGSSTNASGQAFTNLLDARTLFVDSEIGNDATAIKGDAAKPWFNAHIALLAALPGDIVFLREGVHDIGTNLFNVGHGVRVTGRGDGSWLRGSGGLLTNGPVVGLTGSTCEVSHITIENSGRDFYQSAVIGFFQQATNNQRGGTNMTIHDLNLIGDSDSLYLRSTNSWTLRGYNIRSYSKWDNFVQFLESSNGASRWDACYFETDLKGALNPQSLSVGVSSAVKVQGGVAEFLSCSAIGTNGNTSTRGLSCSGGTTRWIGGIIKAAGTNDVLALENLAGTLIYSGNLIKLEESTGVIRWGSEQAVVTNLVYGNDPLVSTFLGLVFDSMDRLNDPIFISASGGVNIGALTDPGASRLQVGSLPGSGDYVAADGNGLLFSTNAPAGSSTNTLVQTNGVNVGSAGTVNWTAGVTGSISGAVATLGVSASGGSGTPAGSNFEIQLNNAGVFGASANLRYLSGQLQVLNPAATGEVDINGEGFISQGVGGQSLAFGIGGNTNLLIDRLGGVFVRPVIGIGTNLFQVENTNRVPVVFVDSNSVLHATSNLIVAGSITASNGFVAAGPGAGFVGFGTNFTMVGAVSSNSAYLLTPTNAAPGIMVAAPTVPGVSNQWVNVALGNAQYLTYNGTAYVPSNLPASSLATNSPASPDMEIAATSGTTAMWINRNAPRPYPNLTNIVVAGDSKALTPGGITAWPNILTQAVTTLRLRTNSSVSGQKAGTILANYQTHTAPWAPGSSSNALLIIDAGINDLNQGTNALDTIRDLNLLAVNAHSNGFAVMISTITPMGYNNNNFSETNRLLLNAMLRTNNMWDYLLDSANGIPHSAMWYTNDMIHYKHAGKELYARNIMLTLAGGLKNPTATPVAPYNNTGPFVFSGPVDTDPIRGFYHSVLWRSTNITIGYENTLDGTMAAEAMASNVRNFYLLTNGDLTFNFPDDLFLQFNGTLQQVVAARTFVASGSASIPTNTAAMNYVTNDLVSGSVNTGRAQRFSVAVTVYATADLTTGASVSLVYSNASTGVVQPFTFSVPGGLLASLSQTNTLYIPDAASSSKFWVTNGFVVPGTSLISYK